MVIASHLIITAYGFWLPNDARGSWSDFVGAWEIYKFGPATKTGTRKSVAADPHDIRARLAARAALKFPPVLFTGIQARAIGRAFATIARKLALRIWACSILPDHTHLVIARHTWPVERIANCLKGESTRQMVEEGIHPLAAYATETGRLPKAWARNQWKVYLDCEPDVVRAVRYVQDNPLKEGKPPQRWSFVQTLPGA